METRQYIKDKAALVDQITERIAIYRDSKVFQNAAYETGLPGFALYYAYLAKFTRKKEYIAMAEQLFEEGVGKLDLANFTGVYESDTIDAHLSQIGRLIIFCRKHNLLNIDSEEYLLELDTILYTLMRTKISVKDFDYACGALASGYYFLNRLKSGHDTTEQLKTLVYAINNFALKDLDGDYYWESPSFYNRIYLGISHGSAMIMSFLSNLYDQGIETELCKDIIEKAANFMFKQYRKTPYPGLFPNKIGDDLEPMQFSLCYGDLGNAYAVYRAWEVLRKESVKAFADIILDDCLKRTKEDNLTLDASIFYGASGIALTFDKLAMITKDQRFESRAQYWYDKIGAYACFDNDYAGFQSRLSTDSLLWNVSFGWGIAGIGINLMINGDNSLPAIDELTFIA